MAVYKVLVSTVVINCLVKGTLKSLGVLMMELDSLGVEPTVASWIPAIAYTLFSVMSSPVARLEQWMSNRKISITGCVIIVLGVVISAFPFVPCLYLGLGFFLGTGGCLCAISGVLEINKRFSGSSRGMAHGFSLAGNTVGGLVVPGLIAVLTDWYGYTAALLLLSAILLHIIPASLLYTNNKRPPVSNDSLATSAERRKVFQNSRLWFSIFSMASTTVGYTNFGLYLPLHLHSTLGWTKPISAGYISLFAVGDLVGRLTGPALSDKFPPRWPWYCSGLAGAGTFMLLLPLASDMFTIGAITISAGLTSGMMVGCYPALLSDELGADNLSLTYPLSQTVAGVLNLAGPPILGQVSQLLTTSHVMVVLGASLIIGSLPLALNSGLLSIRAR